MAAADDPEPDTIVVSMPVQINFPISMFLPTGQLEHRIHRSKFIADIMNVEMWTRMYDGYAEMARQELLKRDPQTVRPPLEKLGSVVLDTKAITKTASEDEEEVPDVHSPAEN